MVSLSMAAEGRLDHQVLGVEYQHHLWSVTMEVEKFHYFPFYTSLNWQTHAPIQILNNYKHSFVHSFTKA